MGHNFPVKKTVKHVGKIGVKKSYQKFWLTKIEKFCREKVKSEKFSTDCQNTF